MDVSKLQSIKVIRVVNRTKNANKTSRHTKIKTKVPRTIRCEVLLLYSGVFVTIDDVRYPLEIRNEDYLKATYAFSSELNPHWDWYTLKSHKFNEIHLHILKDYWWLIKPGLKVYVTLDDGIAYLDIDKMNTKMNAIIKKYKPSYYVNRRHPQV